MKEQVQIGSQRWSCMPTWGTRWLHRSLDHPPPISHVDFNDLPSWPHSPHRTGSCSRRPRWDSLCPWTASFPSFRGSSMWWNPGSLRGRPCLQHPPKIWNNLQTVLLLFQSMYLRHSREIESTLCYNWWTVASWRGRGRLCPCPSLVTDSTDSSGWRSCPWRLSWWTWACPRCTCSKRAAAR